jgi:hypothetical protein
MATGTPMTIGRLAAPPSNLSGIPEKKEMRKKIEKYNK